MTNGDFILILTKDDQKWTPSNPSLLVRVFENVFKRCLLHDLIDIELTECIHTRQTLWETAKSRILMMLE